MEVAPGAVEGNISRSRSRSNDRIRHRSPSNDRGRSHHTRRMMEKDRNTSLVVRNLPHGIKPADVRELVERYGEVRDVYLPVDYRSGRLRGFAFVDFREAGDAR